MEGLADRAAVDFDGVWNLAARAAFILLWVGFMAIFRGVSDIAVAFSLRSFAHEDERQQQPQAGTGVAPPVPTQSREAPAH